MAKKKRSSRYDKKYNRCKKLASLPGFEYDIEIMLFISGYEEYQDLISEN